MSDFEYPADRVFAFEIAATYRSDLDAMRRFFSEDPDLIRKLRERSRRIVCEAAKVGSPDAIRLLVELGADIDEPDSNHFTGLCWAVAKDRYEAAQTLLESGADPNRNCPLFSVAVQDLKDPISMAKLLLDHGADINQIYAVEGRPPRTVLSGALSKGPSELVEFLTSRGARLPETELG